MKTIAITGSEGLIGRAVVSALQPMRYRLRRLALRLLVGQLIHDLRRELAVEREEGDAP